ncbi:MAG: hypothetical protein LBL52_03740 [Rickettsiales bacterium]|jgi:hypothetical protein|nr:hypothetical protein [Rickettsiales bacterium]
MKRIQKGIIKLNKDRAKVREDLVPYDALREKAKESPLNTLERRIKGQQVGSARWLVYIEELRRRYSH